MKKETVFELLKNIYDPKTHQPLINSARIQDFYSDEGRILFSLSIDPTEEKIFQNIQETCLTILKSHFSGKVQISLTHHKSPKKPPANEKLSLPTIHHLIAISSGKGGVGKSTVTFNLALSIQRLGYKVGILDADIYGPSLPLLVNHWEKPLLTDKGEMIPYECFDLKLQSMGFLVEPNQPILWRGPMAQSSFQKILTQTAWGELDFLFIDLPPGTGDIHLTMAQKVPLKGAVIVTTPQDLALIDALKAVKMFQTLKVPLLGLIENMSYLSCPCCEHIIDIYGQEGTRKMVTSENLPFLGALPLDKELRQACDTGQPLTISYPDHKIVKAFHHIAENFIQALDATIPLKEHTIPD